MIQKYTKQNKYINIKHENISKINRNIDGHTGTPKEDLIMWGRLPTVTDISRHHCRMFSQASRDVKKCCLQTLSTLKSRGIQTVLSKLRDATASTSGRLYNWSTFNGPFQIHSVFSAFEKDQL